MLGLECEQEPDNDPGEEDPVGWGGGLDSEEEDVEQQAPPVQTRTLLQDYFKNPGKHFPSYHWETNQLGTRHKIPPSPEKLGAATTRTARIKSNKDHKPWNYGYGLWEPLYWFWSSLEWSGERDAEKQTSYVELAILFQLPTGVTPAQEGGNDDNTDMAARTTFFRNASRRMQAILEGPITPYGEVPCAAVMISLGFEHGPGVWGRPVIPVDEHLHAVLLRAAFVVPRVAQARRNYHWKPDFDRKPKPSWVRGRGAGYRQQKDATPVVARGPSPVSAGLSEGPKQASTDGSGPRKLDNKIKDPHLQDILVAPVTSEAKFRIRKKMNADLVGAGATAATPKEQLPSMVQPIVPVQKPRVAAKAGSSNDVQLTDSEKAELNKFTNKVEHNQNLKKDHPQQERG